MEFKLKVESLERFPSCSDQGFQCVVQSLVALTANHTDAQLSHLSCTEPPMWAEGTFGKKEHRA